MNIYNTDFYKTGHINQYPPHTELVYSNLTPRSSRVEGSEEIVFFGLEYLLRKYLVEDWSDFFDHPFISSIAEEYKKNMAECGIDLEVDHLYKLHELGHLPIKIMALPEGTVSPIGVPVMVMWNTHKDFAWVTNYLETIISVTLWGACTSATTARIYRKMFDTAASVTGIDPGFVDFQGHDFSMRGMFGLEAAQISGAGHLTSFMGTDSIPAIGFIEKYYDGSSVDMVGGSVPATEHSVMCMGGDGVENEYETNRRLIEDIYPTGIVSAVNDTWDFFRFLTEVLPRLKDSIMARDGKFVVRPDSGDPVKIICGDPDAPEGSPEHKGAYEIMCDIFGYETNEMGYKVMDEHVGLIYGDSITHERAHNIIIGLIEKGFAPNIVFGIGAFTYQFVTRDTYGFAVKATAGIINGDEVQIFKAPKTDSGTKTSAKGFLRVDRNQSGVLEVTDGLSFDESKGGEFEVRYENGLVLNSPTIAEVRERAAR